MRVLLLTQVVPYPHDSKFKIKTDNVIKYPTGAEVTSVSLMRLR